MLLLLFLSQLAVAKPRTAPAESAFVQRFTNYSPILKGINGHCGTSASGKDACAYFLEDFLAGKTNAVMGAVPQKGGTSVLFGGIYNAPALQAGLGANKPIVVFAGDRYATDSNGMSKMDIVTRDAKSAPALRVNRLQGELVTLGRAPNLPTPQRVVTRDPVAVAPVSDTSSGANGNSGNSSGPVSSSGPGNSSNSGSANNTGSSTPNSTNGSSVVETVPPPKPICPEGKTFEKDIHNCGKNEVPVQVAQACAQILKTAQEKKAQTISKEMMEANQAIKSGQNSTIAAAKARLNTSINELTGQIQALQVNNAVVANYTNSMIDFKSGKDDKTSLECFSKNYHALQNIVTDLDKQIVQSKAVRGQAITMMNSLGSSQSNLKNTGGAIVTGTDQNTAPAAKALNKNNSSISPSSLPKK